ncbi:GNAT family N-acetyltransferase [Ruania zhangjianzhongii]|uniref:GNAT family N-acetyltransferase n=1 Tax=Ruania zhangjianzhongii TaxID=2603206 RepID=UPI0011C8D023|nr:GNAT family N-acetyltransferase [Ruania zhangjianzhongii]
MPLDDFAPPATLTSKRLRLEPLRTEHAEEMAPVLDDPDLHTFIGGAPATLEGLRGRYSRQATGRSADGSQLWFNWILRQEDGQAVGTVQATVTEGETGLSADVAWVIGSSSQRQGYAREAAQVMVTWLREQGVGEIVAHVHPDHRASAAVARAIGLRPTKMLVDGEIRWQN